MNIQASRRTVVIAGLAGLLLAGCNDRPAAPDAGGPNRADGNGTGTGTGTGAEAAGAPDAGAGQAPGAPKPGGGGGLAPGSPMHMPARTQDQGLPLDPKVAYITSELTTQCGGTLCVKIVVDYSASGFTRCEYYGSDPEPDTTFHYRRNMTIKILAGTDPCDEESPETSPPPETETETSPPPETETSPPPETETETSPPADGTESGSG